MIFSNKINMNLFETYLYKRNQTFKITGSFEYRKEICENVQFIEHKETLEFKDYSSVSFHESKLYWKIERSANSSVFCTFYDLKCKYFFFLIDKIIAFFNI